MGVGGKGEVNAEVLPGLVINMKDLLLVSILAMPSTKLMSD